MKKIWAKIEDGRIVYPPKNDKARGMFNVDKNEKWLVENGFVLQTPEELEPFQPKYEEPPKKYSTLKIIRVLGGEWEGYRTRLEAAGYLDQFFAANYSDVHQFGILKIQIPFATPVFTSTANRLFPLKFRNRCFLCHEKNSFNS